MYRAGLFGLFASVLCVSIAQAQYAPNNGQATGNFVPGVQTQAAPYLVYPPQVEVPEVAYVWSQEETCSCGHTNENYVGGPRNCAGCGQALPEPPAYGSDVEQVGYNDVDLISQLPSLDDAHDIQQVGCFDGSGSKKKSSRSYSSQILNTPAMIGGGFIGVGAGLQQLTGPAAGGFNSFVTIFNVTGEIVSGSGLNSALRFDSGLTAANPDFISVGTGAGNPIVFNVVEGIPPGGLIVPNSPGEVLQSITATEEGSFGTVVNLETWTINAIFRSGFNIAIPDAANAGAAVVGRTRISDNNSPLPRTRAFFNYSLLDNVPLSSTGTSVNRFTPGYEYALGDCKSSVEVRIPFATTLSTDIITDGSTATGHLELGDVFAAYKRVLCEGEDYILSGGCGVTLPSSNDLNVTSNAGQTAVLVENRAIHLMPFLAGIAQLTDRAFYQSFLQVDLDVHGNQVYADDFQGGGLTGRGRIRDTMRLSSSSSFGYWLRKRGEDPDAFFSAIIPTFELHYDSMLEDSNVFQSGPYTFGSPAVKIQNLTGVVGTTFEVTPGEAISVGYSVPMGNSSDQMFDGELRFTWNRYL